MSYYYKRFDASVANLPTCLTLIWVGFLGVYFEVGGVKITPCLKLVRIMVKNSNFARK